MKKILAKIAIALMLIFAGQLSAPTFITSTILPKTYAAKPAEGIPAGGKAATEAAAIEDMKQSVIKRILASITSRSEDPASAYQQLLKRYNEFIESFVVEKKGKNPSGGFFVTGKVKPKYQLMQAELGKINQAAHKNDTLRSVYVFVRFVGSNNEALTRKAEETILDRYNSRFRENKFQVETGDSILNELNNTRSMNYQQFLNFVKKKIENGDEFITVAVVGEMKMSKLSEDSSGATLSCDIDVTAYDCTKNFAVIDEYEGSDVLRVTNIETGGMFLFEKAAITSSKELAEKLVTYWQGK